MCASLPLSGAPQPELGMAAHGLALLSEACDEHRTSIGHAPSTSFHSNCNAFTSIHICSYIYYIYYIILYYIILYYIILYYMILYNILYYYIVLHAFTSLCNAFISLMLCVCQADGAVAPIGEAMGSDGVFDLRHLALLTS